MKIFLSTEIIAFLSIELLLIALMAISLFYIIVILRSWDFEKTTSEQYRLEQKNYLINTILLFATSAKIALFIFFALLLDRLSALVPGAMCSAGVIGSNGFGAPLLLLKLILIFGFGIWLIINALDLKAGNFPFLKQKFAIFIALFCSVLAEFAMQLAFFAGIPLEVPVFCCSSVFQADAIPFGYTKTTLLGLFYAIFILILGANMLGQSMLSFGLNLLFLFVAYYAITYFFGIYLYEMPNHICPYCMLSKEYFYAGYAIWGSLFLGIFFGISTFLVELFTAQKIAKFLKLSTIFLTINALLCSFFVLKYYIKTGLFL